MDGLEKEYGERVRFTRVNILNSENTPIMKQYGFSTAPEVYLVNADGNVIGSWDEIESGDAIRAALELALKAGD